MAREFSRHQRLGTEVLRILADLLRFETKDPRLQRIALTSVDLSRDLSVANVYFSLLDPDADSAPVLDGLQRASGFLRSRLGARLDIRHVPALRFTHDDSAERGARISELIDSALHVERED